MKIKFWVKGVVGFDTESAHAAVFHNEYSFMSADVDIVVEWLQECMFADIRLEYRLIISAKNRKYF